MKKTPFAKFVRMFVEAGSPIRYIAFCAIILEGCWTSTPYVWRQSDEDGRERAEMQIVSFDFQYRDTDGSPFASSAELRFVRLSISDSAWYNCEISVSRGEEPYIEFYLADFTIRTDEGNNVLLKHPLISYDDKTTSQTIYVGATSTKKYYPNFVSTSAYSIRREDMEVLAHAKLIETVTFPARVIRNGYPMELVGKIVFDEGARERMLSFKDKVLNERE
ncbi:MAG: hypothetical protein ACKVRP_01025 [Bacteroidota bacterium]